MNTLEDIAFANLQFLTEKDDFLANRYSVDKNKFIRDDDDTLYSLSDLEYPVFFTFHQLINHIHSSYEPTFHGKTKKELLDMFSVSLDVLSEYHIETDNSNISFELLINDIDEKVSFIKQYYRYGWCHRAPTMIKDYFTSICKTMLDTSRHITRAHLAEMKDPGGYTSEESTDDESTDEEPNNEESDGDMRSCSEESCDIPDVDDTAKED